MSVLPFVSIIVPAYNEEKKIGDCMHALLRLDFPKDQYEIIVVNNGSTDQTRTVLDRYPVISIDEPRRGVSFARNSGIRAAHGQMIAFIDADCIPDGKWLMELLQGAESEEIGCFVGEFAPQPFQGMVDEYVHDRRLIHQRTLLSYHPPVAATGNVAYRKAVFERIGLFDESFTSGEDAELSWRMQRNTQFRIRYHENARVYHPHPASVTRLLRRSRLIGAGIAQFRLKYRDDFIKKWVSPSHYREILFLTALGMLKCPWRVAANLWKGMDFKKGLTYPVLDKLCALAQEVGTLREIERQGSAIPSSQPIKGTASDPVGLPFLEIKNAPLLLKEDPQILSRVRTEIGALIENLLKTFPNATILLTGSFSVGEGKYTETKSRKVIDSDYDLAVITPSFLYAWSAFAKGKTERIIRSLDLSANLEITLIWKPLLKWGFTTIGGAVVGGERDLNGLLACLPAPQAMKSILIGYQFLVEAPLSPQAYSTLLSKALLRGGQGFLLHRYRQFSRKDWIQLSSIRVVLSRIEKCVPLMGEEAMVALKRAGSHLLAESDAKWEKKDYAWVRNVLNSIQAEVISSSQLLNIKNLMKHTGWLCRHRRFGLPRMNTDAFVLKGLRMLSEAWVGEGLDLDRDQVIKASHEIRRLCYGFSWNKNATPMSTYRRLCDLLSSYIVYYPHKLHYSLLWDCMRPDSAGAEDAGR